MTVQESILHRTLKHEDKRTAAEQTSFTRRPTERSLTSETGESSYHQLTGDGHPTD
jgi:hypothetical protein